MRLVGPNGEQVGIVRVEAALRLAAEADLDLVEVAPMAKPPVAKLMDFGKYKYEAALKAREARKNQVNTVIKEIKLRPKIDPHDYETKKGHVVRFLSAGDKVKVTIMFRGREQSRPELGFRLLQRLAQDVVELGFVESAPKQDGRNMIMVLGPTKKKAEAKAEQRRRRDDAASVRQPRQVLPAEPIDTDELIESVENLEVEELTTAEEAPVVEELVQVDEATEAEEITEVEDAEPAPESEPSSATVPAVEVEPAAEEEPVASAEEPAAAEKAAEPVAVPVPRPPKPAPPKPRVQA
ncbi:Translation initiation factor IF-3 [Austwickia sp. TVS 96-490-7B]|nr:Translation initiation factor IF-3 [Austwickia sp. TVS 96-490-7B]